ncbi:CpXC domain-containing protein [Eubacterium limosum]|uniref:CpXC domain-containing protein n=1 Tax=Eubacterium limosum TaxID=1736 RepID=A0ABT5UTR2_EUBLI|nr:CpXC domain-containing protein [Eubacterium limosum]MCB6570979.1 CpXC domain-containing protein [Eubacterium limosum]MDE1472271.1 CpXC domain-containing protein [Eubacterium limosum]
MAKTKQLYLECPECHKQIEIDGYHTINANLDTELRKQLISADVFCHVCPECGARFFQAYSLQYQDMEKKFILILDLGDTNLEEDIKTAQEIFSDYKIRVDNDMLEFMEKIHIFDANLNDKIIVYYDNKIKEDIAKKFLAQNPPIVVEKVLFDSFNLQKKTIVFGAVSNASKPIYINTPYHDYRNLANSPGLVSHFSEQPGEYRINSEWAKQIG